VLLNVYQFSFRSDPLLAGAEIIVCDCTPVWIEGIHCFKLAENINCERKNNVLTDLEKVTSSFEKVLHFLAASVLDK